MVKIFICGNCVEVYELYDCFYINNKNFILICVVCKCFKKFYDYCCGLFECGIYKVKFE